MKDKHIINSFKDLRKAIEEVTASQPAKSRQELQKEKMKPLKEGKNLMPDIDNIVKTKGAKKVGGSMVDLFTASMIQKVYDKVNDANKKKMEKAPVQVLVQIAQKVMGMKEETNFDKVVEGFASDAQRRAAFASGYKAKGKKGKKKKEEVEEGIASFLDNVIKVQQSFSDPDKAEKMLQKAAKKGLIGYNGPMRSPGVKINM